MLGDFVLQTRRMAHNKHRSGWLVGHTAALTGSQVLCLLPFWSLPALAVGLVVGLSHGCIDGLKARLLLGKPERVWPFVADQSLHLLVLLAAALLPGVWGPARLPHAFEAGILVAVYAFNVNGASAIVRQVLRRFSPPESEDEQPGAGRVIGILERLLAVTLVLTNQWGALGLVLAAKSIARFKDLEERLSAEYYLVGTLASLLVAVFSGLLVQALI